VEAIRSKRPDGVRQELWGVLGVAFAVERRSHPRMPRGTTPQRRALHLAATQKTLYPRAVKLKMSNYDRKKPLAETVE
jgi:hypothetical protein